jgi:arylsulfatase A-like enzyme
MADSDRPNVLFVFADQWRTQATGYAGNDQVETPALDRIAEDGIAFENAYSCDPVCTPARGSILTGQYPHGHRVYDNSLALSPGRETIADHLVDAGYHTGFIGKWHLDGSAMPGYVPEGRRGGFEYWNAYNCDHSHLKGHPNPSPDGSVEWEEGYQPALQTDDATDFLERQPDREDPFCLFVSWGPPHTPFEAPPEYRERYDPSALDLPPNVPEDMAEEVREEMAEYYALVTSLDDQIARLSAALEETGQAEDTILVVTSDHGELMGAHGEFHKDSPLEESINVPLVIRYPDRIAGGRESDAVVNLTDYAPTLCSLCGVTPPEAAHGRDVSDHLLEGAPGPSRSYIEGNLLRRNPWRTLRTERYMLTVDEELEVQCLFDMERDPYQRENLAGRPEAAETEERLHAELLEMGHDLGDQFLTVRDYLPEDGLNKWTSGRFEPT